jgi:hypothetical protein
MKAFQFLVFVLAVIVAEPLFAQSIAGTVQRVNPAENTLAVSGPQGSSSTFQVNATTEITLNGKLATLNNLTAGTFVLVSPGDEGFAGKIVSPAEIQITVSAKANRSAPVRAVTVSAGQNITIVPGDVRWCGGGTRKGVFTGWTGYAQGGNSIPWMALVAAIGDKEFWAKGDTLSFVAPTDGSLDLYANDAKPDDNTGQAHLTVTITAK